MDVGYSGIFAASMAAFFGIICAVGHLSGFLLLGFGAGGILGPWRGGYIFDRTHSYNHALLVTILALIAASSLIWIVSPRKIIKSVTVK